MCRGRAIVDVQDGQAQVNVQAQLALTARTSDALNFQLTIVNSGKKPVYITIDPERVDNSKGPYLSQAKDDSSLLLCAFSLYPPPPYYLYVNGTAVRLKLLNPGVPYVEQFSLALPIQTTEPPYYLPRHRQLLHSDEVRRIQALVGVLPSSEPINQLLKQKAGNTSVNGVELLQVAGRKKPLYEFQVTVASSPAAL